MLVVHVQVQVKPDHIEAFRDATFVNARSSLAEPGVVRFDVLQQLDAPERFVLVEVYRAPEDAARHKETEHYKQWRETVADMMAVARSSTKYHNVFPGEADFDTPWRRSEPV